MPVVQVEAEPGEETGLGNDIETDENTAPSLPMNGSEVAPVVGPTHDIVAEVAFSEGKEATESGLRVKTELPTGVIHMEAVL